MHGADQPGLPPEEAEQRRRRAKERRGRVCECDWCDGCDLCDALWGWHVLRVSTVLVGAAALAPRRRGTGAVRAVIVGYRRWLTRYTAHCPSTPSCSTYALDAVERLGPRRGLRAAAQRVRSCGRAR